MAIAREWNDKQSPSLFDRIGRLPAPADNVAIAGRTLAAGTSIIHGEGRFALDCTILEGHRFAVAPIAAGEPLLSWGLPFGVATQDITPGSYICNQAMIEALSGRRLDFPIPTQPNFRDQIRPYTLEDVQFRPGKQVSPHEEERIFMGYRRSSARGVGTRNKILILGTTSRAAGYVRQLEARLQSIAVDFPNLDGIVAIAHTEGSGDEPLNNRQLLLRTLAGLVVHANVGAALIVDTGSDQISNQSLRQYLVAQEYPLDDVRHHFLTLAGDFQADLARGETIIRDWLLPVNDMAHSQQSLSHLNLALQCGGSDAFSGVSGNPLAAAVAREIIRYGGSANLGETDELIGAEAYMLQNVRDLATAHAFLGTIARFKERLSWHGVTAEGNPSGGNRYRGLYNIVLKSIGAAMKRHPEVRLDHVIEYGRRMVHPGFYFMDTPGNDLESIAGQVAGGSSLILFVTGNGSITNFPLVPTIKIMTTTGRYRMLAHDMDVNAGAYQDGIPMADLAAETLELTIAIASGQRSAGEKAGHAQVSIWRNWRQRDGGQLAHLKTRHKPTGDAIPIHTSGAAAGEFRFQAMRAPGTIGLILPTSICAGQIARLTAQRLNEKMLGIPRHLSRFVTLTHTEGCGVAVQASSEYCRTIINYATHPLVRFTLFLEHGCEKTHNDYMRRLLEKRRLRPERFGWASIQLDGGIESVMGNIEEWFAKKIATADTSVPEVIGLDCLSLGLLSSGPVTEPVGRAMSQLVRTVVGAGGTVILPEQDDLLATAAFVEDIHLAPSVAASLSYGQQPGEAGFHVMETPSKHWVETLTGLGATGVSLMLAAVVGRPLQGHPLVPLFQVQVPTAEQSLPSVDYDLILQEDESSWVSEMLRLCDGATGSAQPRLLSQGNVDFQITRGLLGIST